MQNERGNFMRILKIQKGDIRKVIVPGENEYRGCMNLRDASIVFFYKRRGSVVVQPRRIAAKNQVEGYLPSAEGYKTEEGKDIQRPLAKLGDWRWLYIELNGE
ncbi:hypothetical protein L484_011428 [Morus notabilis]|uniref:Uncharacterized protein n=1 Tax=Morus notabilis TaxID=981085 RepID=W9QVR9_9ROSA|nr:hypothetical protein L484_011428 [Morus notabilis]